jgi:hypothetical protein
LYYFRDPDAPEDAPHHHPFCLARIMFNRAKQIDDPRKQVRWIFSPKLLGYKKTSTDFSMKVSPN